MKTLIITVSIFALSAVVGAIVVGVNVFDGVVVEKPYETGLEWDRIQNEQADSGALNDKGLHAVFDINPKPVRAMSELVFSMYLEESGRPVTDADITLDLTMPGMFMGINRPVLKHVKDGRYEGKGVIPACPHGGKQWKAEVNIERGGKVETASYTFEVNQ
ncbi:MAG: FixH family protein [Nitrospirae bacterium]|nr:FixH family protein [Nitrospirota bacterium]